MKSFQRAFLLILSFYHLNALAQEVRPGPTAERLSQAAGSTSVDLQTGVLHYSIPLMQIGQDGYNIPINLSYSAKGVKVKESIGETAGVGWSLSYGAGIITRSIRGTFPDEFYRLGKLYDSMPPGETTTPQWLAFKKKVSTRLLDGESDIFTLSLPGASVQFILARSGSDFIAKPLTKTDLVINYTVDIHSGKIEVFQVVDPQGNKYEFEMALPSVACVYNAVQTNSFAVNAPTSWYLTKISLFNNDEIKFVYKEKQYAEVDRQFTPTYVYYTNPLIKPSIGHNGVLLGTLQSLQTTYTSTGVQIGQLYQNCINAANNVSAYQSKVKFAVDSSINPELYYNKMMLLNWQTELSYQQSQLQSVSISNQAALSQIVNVLAQIYSDTLHEAYSFTTTGYNNVLPGKLISSIVTRNGAIDFEYQEKIVYDGPELNGYYRYSRINYRSINGELLKYVLFDHTDKGLLKKMQFMNKEQHVESEYNFEYYNEAGLLFETNAQDYWGFYNGKDSNAGLFPLDPVYFAYSGPPNVTGTTIFGPDYSAILPSNYLTNIAASFYGLGDRKPDGSKSMCRSLKSVINNNQGKISFEYEGNTAFMSEVNTNVPVGGIRIKSVKEETIGTPAATTMYKYEFPLLSDTSKKRSTGRFIDKNRKHFQELYTYPGGVDIFLQSDFVDTDATYDDKSNNGVLYHYAEVIYPDGSHTGYKYMAANPFSLSSDALHYHQSLLDDALLATIDYDVNDKIVRIIRNGYISNIPSFGNFEAEEMFVKRDYPYIVQDTTVASGAILQFKAGTIYYDRESLLASLPNTATNVTTINSNSFSINPYMRIYLPNYVSRTNVQPTGKIYQVLTNTFLLPREKTEYTFTDYDMASAYASVNFPGLEEKAYLFERLLHAPGIKMVKNIEKYRYRSDFDVYPRVIITSNSKGDTLLKRIKYSVDYTLASTTAPVRLLKEAGNTKALVEEQTWLQKAGETTYKLLSGRINNYSSKAKYGRNYLLPDTTYIFTASNGAVIPGFGETATPGSGYSQLFWENQTLYKPEVQAVWGTFATNTKMLGTRDRTGQANSGRYVDPNLGNILVEAVGVDPESIASFDGSPYSSHYYYYSRFNLYNQGPKQRKREYSFLAFPLTIGNVSLDLMYAVSYAKNVLHYIDSIELLNPTATQQIRLKDYYNKFRLVVQNLADRRPLNEISLAVMNINSILSNFQFSIDYNGLVTFIGNQQAQEYTRFLMYVAHAIDSNLANYESSLLDNDLPGLGLRPNDIIPLSIAKNRLPAGISALDVYCASWSSTNTINYKFRYSNGSYSSNFAVNLVQLNNEIYQQTIQIVNGPGNLGVDSVIFTTPRMNGGSEEFSLVVVPKGTIFKAYSYLPGGVPLLSYDQTGRYLHNFYDEHMRPAYTKDAKDNVIKSVKFSGSGLAPRKSPVMLTIKNIHPVSETSPTITSVWLDNITSGHSYRIDVYIRPGFQYSLPVFADTFSISLTCDKPIKKIVVGSSSTLTNSLSFSGSCIMTAPPKPYDLYPDPTFYIDVRPEYL